jgi:hypothetical protein
MPRAPHRSVDPPRPEQHRRPTAGGHQSAGANGHHPTSMTPEPGQAEQPGPTAGLARAAWSVTSVGFAVGALILLMQGYYGYASVAFAVAVAAAINLL